MKKMEKAQIFAPGDKVFVTAAYLNEGGQIILLEKIDREKYAGRVGVFKKYDSEGGAYVLFDNSDLSLYFTNIFIPPRYLEQAPNE